SPDLTGNIAMSATSAKVALVSSTTVLPCGQAGVRCWPTQTNFSLVDYVGYGIANDWEGSAAATQLDNTHSDVRGNGGCTDNDNNASDFTLTAQASFVIHNSQSPANNCGGTATPTPTATFTPAPPGILT